MSDRAMWRAHAVYCVCPECCEQARARQQHLTDAPPLTSLDERSVSTREFHDFLVLEDWNDD